MSAATVNAKLPTTAATTIPTNEEAAVVGSFAFTVAALMTYALFQMYLRYYALLMLGDVDDGLDYIPGRRSTVRGDKPGDPVADPTDPGASDGDDPQFPS